MESIGCYFVNDIVLGALMPEHSTPLINRSIIITTLFYKIPPHLPFQREGLPLLALAVSLLTCSISDLT